MEYIFISPHLDDVSLSCGGIVHQLSKMGESVQIWTIFAGDPPSSNYPTFAKSLHQRWKISEDFIKVRRTEDIQSCEILGAKAIHFSYPDCIYRYFDNHLPVVQKEEDLYQDISGNQRILVKILTNKLTGLINTGQIIVSPLSIGNHIDHQIVYESIKNLNNILIFYYTDYPYNLKSEADSISKIPENYVRRSFNLTEKDLLSWHHSISAFKSQISTFWKDENEMVKEIRKYAIDGGGNHLWEPMSDQI